MIFAGNFGKCGILSMPFQSIFGLPKNVDDFVSVEENWVGFFCYSDSNMSDVYSLCISTTKNFSKHKMMTNLVSQHAVICGFVFLD